MQRERERDEARAEADKLRETLLSKHGGEPLALLRELDEARAEVERLRMALEHADNAMRVVNDSIRAAYRRGAEAMREVAAQLFDGKPTVPGLATMPPYAEAVRALPIPEDKP